MLSFVALLPLFIAASSAVAFPQKTNAAAIAAGNAAASKASAAAVSAAAQYTQGISASAVAASKAALYTAGDVNGGAALPASGHDECGPTIPDPRVPDSCGSYVDVSTGGAMPYNASCLNDGTGAVLDLTSCEDLIQAACAERFRHAGEWVWASSAGCSMGTYLPPRKNPDGTPTGAARWPSSSNCEALIFGSMLDVCAGPGHKYNTIAVNLPVLPNNTPKGTGRQVNAGYGSYLITPYQPRNQTDVPGQMVPNEIPVASYYSAGRLQNLLVQSSMLATMTGITAATQRSDLSVYMATHYGH